MENNNSGVPLLNCLLQHTLRSLCAYSDTSSKWVYAVFWRILPRNYPPPKWDYGGSALDRSKGNKRNWILVWEDGHCDFNECEQAGRFGADVFFKMSHEVYSYGEGLVGKVAADNSHKWVFRDPSNEGDPIPNFISSSWNLSIEPQPRAWDVQFKSGIQTIAIISVREGIIQLGSLDKIVEDLNLVINIQRKFSYLQTIPGVFSMQRPHQNPYHALKPNPPITGPKRLFSDTPDHHSQPKSLNFGWNTPQNGASSSAAPAWQPLSCSLGALLSKLPSVMPYSIEPNNYSHNNNHIESQNPSVNVKLESSSFLDAFQEDQKPNTQLASDHRSSGCSKS